VNYKEVIMEKNARLLLRTIGKEKEKDLANDE
jgi:hypothetical protein